MRSGAVITRSIVPALFCLLVFGAVRATAQPPAPPQIVTTVYDTNVQIRFASDSNVVYRVMTRTNATTGAWRAIRAGITATTQTDVAVTPHADRCYYGVQTSPLRTVPYDFYTWYRATANPDYALRVRGYIIYYPNVIEVAIEMLDLTAGTWKPVVTTATMPNVSFSGYLRNVSPDNKIVVHGHDNNQGHPNALYYLYIRKVANPNSKVIVPIPEALASVRFNEDKTITVNGLYTYARDGQAQP